MQCIGAYGACGHGAVARHVFASGFRTKGRRAKGAGPKVQYQGAPIHGWTFNARSLSSVASGKVADQA
eukprot:365862-Chlamydomonas_euryale.AAC.15